MKEQPQICHPYILERERAEYRRRTAEKRSNKEEEERKKERRNRAYYTEASFYNHTHTHTPHQKRGVIHFISSLSSFKGLSLSHFFFFFFINSFSLCSNLCVLCVFLCVLLAGLLSPKIPRYLLLLSHAVFSQMFLFCYHQFWVNGLLSL